MHVLPELPVPPRTAGLCFHPGALGHKRVVHRHRCGKCSLLQAAKRFSSVFHPGWEAWDTHFAWETSPASGFTGGWKYRGRIFNNFHFKK